MIIESNKVDNMNEVLVVGVSHNVGKLLGGGLCCPSASLVLYGFTENVVEVYSLVKWDINLKIYNITSP